MRRVVPSLIVVAIAATSSIAIPLSAPASAAARPQCKKVLGPPPKTIKGVLTTNNVLSQCSPVTAIGATGKQVVKINVKVNGKPVTTSTITWSSGKGTTLQTLTYKAQATKGKCPASSASRLLVTNTVTGGTNKAIKKGTKSTTSLCIAKNNGATLEPGTFVVF